MQTLGPADTPVPTAFVNLETPVGVEVFHVGLRLHGRLREIIRLENGDSRYVATYGATTIAAAAHELVTPTL